MAGKPKKQEGQATTRLQKELEWVRAAAGRHRRGAIRLGADMRVSTQSGSAAEHAAFLFAEQQVIVDDSDLARVETLLDEWQVGRSVADPLIEGVTLLGVETDDLPGLLDRFDDALGVGVVTPNHVLDVQSWSALCPATEPVAAKPDERWPVAADPHLGKGVRVAMLDTGFIDGFQNDADLPWLHDIERFDPDDEVFRPGSTDVVAPYGGHGTFAAGVLRSVAPAVEVTVDDVLMGGVVDEATIVRQLVDALASSPDVLSVSAGTYSRKNVPPKALAAFYERRLRHFKGVAVVAAAGNQGTRVPFWPAAFPWAVSVGALTRTGQRREDWSNHGGWVDVYAPGDVVSAFPKGRYTYLDGRTRALSTGFARWAGTSFSTPLVAGMVARRMAQTGENGRQAAEGLLEVARAQFQAGVGPRLLP